MGHPFTAFAVIFSQAITTLDVDDLNILSEIVAIMEHAKRSCSKITRLHYVCSVLYNVAKVYVEDRLTSVRNRNYVENDDVNGNRMIGPFLRVTSDAVDTTDNNMLGGVSNNNGLFAKPFGSSSLAGTTTAKNNEPGAGMDTAIIAATRSDPASLSFLGSGSGLSTSSAAIAAAMPGGGLAGLGSMGNVNLGSSFETGADSGTDAGTNIRVGGGGGGGVRFLDDSSLSMVELGGSPTFGWLPTGQNMVSLLDTDMDVFDI